MRWILDFLTSSIGRKLLMSLTGIFLILFLIVHLAGNLQLVIGSKESFNLYTEFMGHNPLIQFIAKGLYALILLHTILGIFLAIRNRQAKGSRYAVSASDNASWASKNMALLGILIFAFLLLHMGDFWWKLKFKDAATVEYDGEIIKDAFLMVSTSFSKLWIVIAYLVGQLALGFHLWHGFGSAFQTLGINHRKYTPAIEFMGKAFAIIVPVAFAIIPIVMFINK